MREILFRGQPKKCEWIYGTYYHQSEFYGDKCDCDYIIESCDELEDNMMIFSAVFSETVGQFTGLTDTNGKKIFEGDIVRLEENIKKSFNISDGIVKYGWGGFYIGKFGMLNSLNAIASTEGVLRGEIIGNIHDNPELLDGEAE